MIYKPLDNYVISYPRNHLLFKENETHFYLFQILINNNIRFLQFIFYTLRTVLNKRIKSTSLIFFIPKKCFFKRFIIN